MSDITIKKLQDAEAFFTKLQEDKIQSLLFSIKCSFDEEVQDLDNLHSYETRKIVELINTKVNFGTILDTIEESIDNLEKKESKA